METKFACEGIIRRYTQEGIEEILLGRRGAGNDGQRRGAGQLALVGGHVEAGETSEEALARELGEELGLTFADALRSRIQQDTVFVTEDLRRKEHIRYIHCSYVLDVSDVKVQPVNAEPEECMELIWISTKDISIDVLFAPHRQVIESYLANRSFAITTIVQ